MAYIVTSSTKTNGNREIGRYEDFESAEAAARNAGAIGEPQGSGRDYVYDVDGHEGDDAYGLWIEVPR